MGTNNKIYKKSLLILVIIFLGHYSMMSQNKNEKVLPRAKINNFWTNVRFGGGLGLDFGNGFFSATIAPSAIYEFDNMFSLGIGLNATFNNQKDFSKSTILGGSIIGLANVTNTIQLSAEFEQLNVNRSFDNSLNMENDNYWVPAIFVGAGYRNGNVTFGVRYDLLYDDEKSIYLNAWAPFVRFYF